MYNTGLHAIGRRITGYAIVFNVKSQWLQEHGRLFREIIKPESCSQAFVDSQDVRCQWMHDNKNGIFARSNKGRGTLTLTVDSVGLKYSFIAKDTALGNEILAMVKDGDITESSFSFACGRDSGKTITKDSEGELHIITKMSMLTDVSPVIEGAYAETGSREYVTEKDLDLLKNLQVNQDEIDRLEAGLQVLNKQEALEAKNTANALQAHKELDEAQKACDIEFKRYYEEFRNKYLPEHQTATYKEKMQEETIKSKEYQDIQRQKEYIDSLNN
jgi:uncharacterized protein